MRLDRKQWKIIAGAAGIAAVAVVTTMLILGAIAAPDNDTVPDEDVAALVNGEAITADDVLARQMREYRLTGSWPDRANMLEQLITEKLLYQKATQEGYVPTLLETEVDLLVRLSDMGMTRQDFELQLGWQGLTWERYLEEHQEQMAIGVLLAAELQWPPVTDEEVREYYEYFSEKYPDSTRAFEEMEEGIRMLIDRQRKSHALAPFIEDLRDRADIEIVQPEQ